MRKREGKKRPVSEPAETIASASMPSDPTDTSAPEPHTKVSEPAETVAPSPNAREPAETVPPAGNIAPAETTPPAAKSGEPAETIAPLPKPSGPSETLPRDFGDYRLLSRIARGGMGVVYQAFQKQAGRNVALKMILSGTLAGSDDVRRFYNEAEAAARLDHPNIVPIFDVGNVEGQHYYSMAYVDGPTLKQRTDEGPLPPREAAELMRVISGAIAYAHREGVIHRDLKPANVLLTADGTPRITDFGLAKQIDAEHGLTMSGQLMGTPSYMAPEQTTGDSDRIGPRSDVYSLGAMLYELLTGNPPFQAATPFEVVKQLLEQEPVPPRQWNRGIDRDLETICLRCLEKDPRRRYASAEELSDELRRYLKGEPIKARPLGPVARAWRWSRRHRLVAGSLAAAATLLVMAAVGGVVVAYQQSRLADQLAKMVTQRNDLLEEQKARVAEQSRSNQQLRESSREQEQLRRTAQFEATRARHVAYGGAMDVARMAIAEGRRARALELLNRFRPRAADEEDLRGFDWYLLRQAAETLEDQPLKPLPPFDHAIRLDCGMGQGRAAAFSPDGSLLASLGPDGSVRVWNMRTRPPRVVRDLASGEGLLLGLCFSHDGRRLAASTGDTHEPGAVTVWDVESWEELLQLQGLSVAAQDVRFTLDDKQLVTVDGNAPVHGQIKFWDLETGQLARSVLGNINEIRGVDFSRDGRLLAIGGGWSDSRGEACVIDSATGQLVRDFEGPSRIVNRMAFSPDGEFLVTAEGAMRGDGCVRVFEVATGTERLQFATNHESINAVAISPDGRRIASGGRDRRIRIWDARSGQELLQLDAHKHAILDLKFSPDGWSLVSVGHPMDWFFRKQPDQQGEVLVWDATPPEEPVECRGHTDRIVDLCLLPAADEGEPILASLSRDESIRFWSLGSGGLSIGRSEHRIRYPLKIAAAPDGRSLATVMQESPATAVLAFWEAPTGKFLRKTSIPLGHVEQLAFSPDGATLAVSGSTLDFSAFGRPNPGNAGKKSSGIVSKVLMYSMPDLSGRPRGFESTSEHYARLAFSPDGQRLAVGASALGSQTTSVVRLLDPRPKPQQSQQSQPRGLEPVSKEPFSGLAFSSDGKRLAASQLFPMTRQGAAPAIRQYDAQSGEVVQTILVPGRGFVGVAYAGDQLVAMDTEGVVHFFDARSGQLTKRLAQKQDPGGGLHVSSDGRLLVTVSPRDYRILVWDTATGRPCVVDGRGRLKAASSGSAAPAAAATEDDPAPAATKDDTAAVATEDDTAVAVATEDDTEELARLSRAMEDQPQAAGPCVQRGQHHLRRGRWSLAAADFREAARWEPQSIFHWMLAAVLLVLSDQEEDYRRLCGEMLEQFGETKDVEFAERLCKSCSIGPWEFDQWDALPLQIFTRPMDDGTAPEAFVPWGTATRALAAYRRGDSERAVEWASKVVESPGYAQVRAMGLAVQALAYQQLGRADEARRAADEAARSLPAELRSFFEPDLVRVGPAGGNAVAYDWLVPQALLLQAQARLETP